MSEFLLEIGAEEIPDWMIEPALADLRTKFQKRSAKRKTRRQRSVGGCDSTAAGVCARRADGEAER